MSASKDGPGIVDLINQTAIKLASAFNSEGALRPSVDFVSFDPAGGFDLISLPNASEYFRSARSKDALAVLIKEMLSRAPDDFKVGVLVCHEAWVRKVPLHQSDFDPTIPPSEAPDREEVIICMLSIRGGGNYVHSMNVDPLTKKVTPHPYSNPEVLGASYQSRFQAPGTEANPGMGDEPPPVMH